MKKMIWLVVALLISTLAMAQHTDKGKTVKHSKAVKVPAWAPAHHYDAKAYAYFPDYYTFYDPTRGGYLYWDKNNFSFSSKVPSFMK